MNNRKCSLVGCGKPHYGRGFCGAHYKRYKLYGDPTGTKKRLVKPNIVREIDSNTIEMDLTQGYKCILDMEDYDRIKNLRWAAAKRKNNDAVYAMSTVPPSLGRKTVRMHRLILNCPESKEVDHIGGVHTTLDNRKQNLRIVSSGQNSMNQSLKSRVSSTGHKNIYRRKHGFVVQIRLDGKLHSIGSFKNIGDAISKRDEKLLLLHGEYSRVLINPRTVVIEDAWEEA